MSQPRLSPPEPAPCLVRAYPSSQKGGTLIVEAVRDLATHLRRICDPDGYRPASCPRCLGGVLHVHDYRERKLRAEVGAPSAVIVRHRCASCRAIWRMLPLFIARWLWRTWHLVEERVQDCPPPAAAPPVPERTLRRWRERLASSARHLVQVLATSGQELLESIATAVGAWGTRAGVVSAYGEARGMPARGRLCALAALVHRLVAGVRLM